jgi:hypothetical protein
MSDLRKATIMKADERKKAGCCDSDQDKHGKHQAASPIAPGKAKPGERGAHEHADGVEGGCCGGGKAAK